MSTLYGMDRSNSFRVKDVNAFQAAIDKTTCGVEKTEQDGVTRFTIYGDDEGFFPSSMTVELLDVHGDVVEETDVDLDLVDFISPHLPEGEVVVLMGVSFERASCGAGATAFDHTGESVLLQLHDIYELAKDKFGVDPNRSA
jgi:hypothetical protein